ETNFAASALRSVKPAPSVCTVNSEDTMVVVLTVEEGVREMDLDEVITSLPIRRPGEGPSNLAVDVLLHLVGYLDQSPPRPLQERHHALHVAVARQRDFDLAFAFGDLRLALLQRIRFRQRLFD